MVAQPPDSGSFTTTQSYHSLHALPRYKLDAHVILATRNDVPELAHLVALREKGWNDEKLDEHFRDQRSTADNPDHDSTQFWFRRMKTIMNELDRAVPFVYSRQSLDFLDIGCAPGGFSSYILEKNPRAHGTGITLPVAQGGHGMLLEREYFSAGRYKLLETDILEYDLSLPAPYHGFRGNRPRIPPTFLDTIRGRFPLVIVDAHALRTYQPLSGPPPTDPLPVSPDSDGPRPYVCPTRAFRDVLLISQLILALTALRNGGTLVVKLTHVECLPAAPIIFLLDRLTDGNVRLYKPRTMHQSRGTFYAIARGVRETPRKERGGWLRGLRALWRELRFGGPGGGCRPMRPEELDFIISADGIIHSGYLDRLVWLSRSVWKTQAQGLVKLLERRGAQ